MPPRTLKKEQALSTLLQQLADQEEDVVRFRKQFLNKGVISWDKVEGWIKRHAEADGPPTDWLHVPVPSEYVVELDASTGRFFTQPPLAITKEMGATAKDLKYLSYAIRSARRERVVLVAHGGVLDKLRVLSGCLAKRYGWQEPQATLFVLTGNIPAVAPLSITANLERITLEVNPSVTPRELADHYRKVRKKLLEQRSRTLSEKHLNLAVFPGRCAANTTWNKRLDKWNEEYPQWAYDDLENFSRDCRRARKRLLDPSISIKRVLSTWQSNNEVHKSQTK